MRPDVTMQIQRTKGVRQTGKERLLLAGPMLVSDTQPTAGQLDITTYDAARPSEQEELAARALMAFAVNGARYTVRSNGDGTFTHSYRFTNG